MHIDAHNNLGVIDWTALAQVGTSVAMEYQKQRTAKRQRAQQAKEREAELAAEIKLREMELQSQQLAVRNALNTPTGGLKIDPLMLGLAGGAAVLIFVMARRK